MKKIIVFTAFYVSLLQSVNAQGCIPVRNISGLGQYNLTENTFSFTNWQLNLTNRYFRSFRDFREDIDLKTPAQNQSVNEVYTLDISLSRMYAKGWSLNVNIPVTANARTSSFEHGGPNTTRHTTHSFGTGDLRLTVYKWILRPAAKQKWNLQLGLGLKFPTGDYKYQDYFYRNDTTRILSAINPSIQLGDGGTGLITELNTFYAINKVINFYGNFYYLINPGNENGTLYTMGKTPTSVQIQADALNTSVPDVFSIRAGVSFNFKKLSFSTGIRDEGTPVHDLIGKNDGARRAGHYLSIEPGILYRMKSTALYAYLPVIVDRRIKQNVPDKNITKITGTNTVGPGGSANILILAGVSFKF